MVTENTSELLLSLARILEVAVEVSGRIEENRLRLESSIGLVESWLKEGRLRSDALLALVRETSEILDEAERRKMIETAARILQSDTAMVDAMLSFEPGE